jgi:hypothetical protein
MQLGQGSYRYAEFFCGISGGLEITNRFTDPPTASFTSIGSGTFPGELRLLEGSASGTNYVGLKSPTTLAGNVTYTLPTADGSSGQVLSTSGTGTLSWATAAGGGDMLLGTVQIVTALKTFGAAGAVGKFAIAGTTSGSTVLDASATASGTLTLPAATDTLVGKATTDTLTNKRITQRVVTASDATSITPNTDNADITYQANTQAGGTLTINADGGTPTNGQKWILKTKTTNAQTFAWNAQFVGSTDLALPTVTTAAKVDYFGFIWEAVASKWNMVAKMQGF